MPTLEIAGKEVEVDDAFLKLSPQEQNKAVEEIAARLGMTGQQPEETAGMKRNLQKLSDMTRKPSMEAYNQTQFDNLPSWQKPLVAAQDSADLIANGMTMGFGNKAAALGRSMLTDQSYDDALAEMKAKTQAARERSGYAGTFAEFGGAIATPAALGAKGITAIGRFGPGLGGRMLAGATEGAAYGGLSAAGNDTSIPTGIAAGGLLGGAIPAVAAGVGAVTRPVRDAIAGYRNPEGFAARKVAERVGDTMSMSQAANRMAANPGSSLADVGGASARSLLRTATNIPGPAKQRVNAMLAVRQFGQGDRLKSAISRTFADPDGYMAAKDEIAAEAQRLAAPLYKQAYANPTHYSKTLEDVLSTPAGKRALAKAQTLAANEQIPFQQLFVNIADNGSATVRRVPDTRGWDYIKRAMDDMIDGQTDPITKKVTNEGRTLVGLKNRMLSEIDRINPDYKAARQAFAGQAQLDDALEMGRKALQMPPEALQRALKGMTPAEKASARVGAAEALRKQIDATGVTNNVLFRIFAKPSHIKNLSILFETPEKFAEFRKAVWAEARKRATYDTVRGNSTTIAQGLDMLEAGGTRFQPELQAAKTAATGGPMTAAFQYIGTRLKMLGGLTPTVADNIAKQLMTTNPQQVGAIVQRLQQIEQANISATERQLAIQALLSRAVGVGAGTAIAEGAQ